jgi:ribosomal protein S18 acetylase RimI-like enzyme
MWSMGAGSSCYIDAWYIAPPASKVDWEQLAKLLAEQNSPNDTDRLSRLQWDLWGRRQTQDTLYRRYVRNARKLKGTKYAVFLAKEWGEILGVAEMGIRQSNNNQPQRPTLGVLCVSPNARRRGVGTALVQKCEQVAAEVWQEENLWVEVEKSNIQAKQFFEMCGYLDTAERSMVTVQQGQSVEQRPHIVLSKPLPVFSEPKEKTV